MRLATFSPYGLMHREAGLIYLLANFLHKNGAEVFQLRCDGAQPTCARIAEMGGVRTPFLCSQCMSEQRELAQWSGAKAKTVSSCLSAEDISQVSTWLASVKSEELFRVEFRGSNLWEACRAQFLAQWHLEGGQEIEPHHEANLRELYSAFMYTRIATERFVGATKPTLHCVATPADSTSQAYVVEARRASAECALFSYFPDDEIISVETSGSTHRYETRLILDGITSMRSDPRTWAPEVTAVVHEILSFLGCAPDRVI